MTIELVVALSDATAAWAAEHPVEVAETLAVKAAEDRARRDPPQEQFPGQRQMLRLRYREMARRERAPELADELDAWRRKFYADNDLPYRTPEEAQASLRMLTVDEA